MAKLWESDEYKVTIELQEPLLGTVPKDKETYRAWILEKARKKGIALTQEQQEEEVSTVAEMEEKGWTGFHEDEDGAFIYDYQLKGFLCEAAKNLKQFGTIKQLQSRVKNFVFPKERRIRLPEVSPEPLERPLRVAFPARCTLVRSDKVEAGAQLTFTLEVLEGSGGITQNCLEQLLDYGSRQGLGQWRSGGFGRFKVISVEAQ